MFDYISAVCGAGLAGFGIYFNIPLLTVVGAFFAGAFFERARR